MSPMGKRAPLVLREIIRRFPWLRHVFADGGYAGDKLRDALRRIGKWTVEIVKRSDVAKGLGGAVSLNGIQAALRSLLYL
jgi:transposase